MHCGRFSRLLTRREMLLRCANGFGAVALAALLAEDGRAAPASEPSSTRGRHHAAKARNVIFLYMDGGPSQVDTFDPKPLLAQYHGKDPHAVFKVEPTQFNNVVRVMASPWKLKNYGESGLPVSELSPHAAGCADELGAVRSLVSTAPSTTAWARPTRSSPPSPTTRPPTACSLPSRS